MELLVRFGGPVGLVLLVVLVLVMGAFAVSRRPPAALPLANLRGKMSLEQTLASRRSIRSFKSEPLTGEQIAQLFWAGQGVTEQASGKRTAPSAGALYPLELHVCTAEGVEHYLPKTHAVEQVSNDDLRLKLQAASLGQPWVGQAPAVFVISAVIARTQIKYHDHAKRYVLIEVGHAAQNILLQAVALNLGAVPVGAFHQDQVAETLALPPGQTVLYLIPVGQPLVHK